MKTDKLIMNITMYIYLFNIFLNSLVVDNLYSLLIPCISLMVVVAISKKKLFMIQEIILWVTLIIFCFISVFSSVDQSSSVNFTVILCALTVFLIISSNFADYSKLMNAIKLFSGIHVVMIFLEFFNPELFFSLIGRFFDLRASQEFYNYGSYMGINLTTGIAAVFVVVFMGCIICEMLNKKGSLLVNLILLSISFFCLTLTNKRFSIIVVILEILCFIFMFSEKNKRKNYFKGVLYAVLFILALYFINVQLGVFDKLLSKFTYTIQQGDISNGRIELWGDAIEVFKSNIFYGIGIYSINTDMLATHNVYLQVLAETGIFGCISYVIMVFTFLLITYKSAIQDKNKDVLILLSLFFQLFFSLYSFFGNPFYDKAILFLYVFFISYSCSIKLQKRIVKNKEEVLKNDNSIY